MGNEENTMTFYNNQKLNKDEGSQNELITDEINEDI